MAAGRYIFKNPVAASDTVSPERSAPLAARVTSLAKPNSSIVAVSLLAFALSCGAWVWFATVFPETGWDFPEFYLAGRVPVGSLYDQEVFREHGERLLAPLGVDYYPPYVRPAIFCLPLRALMQLPYWSAYVAFATLQFAFYLAALYVLRKQFEFPIELLAGFGLFYPATMGIVTGQDSNTLAFLLSAGLVLLLNRRNQAAGIVLALCLYKYNLTLLLPILLLVKGRYEAFKWFFVTGILLATGSAIVAPPSEYVTLLQNISNYTVGFSPDKMIGLRALAYGIGHPWLYFLFTAIVAGGSVWAMRRLPMPHAYCVTILGALLCSYHVNWYDGAVLLIPLVLAFSSHSTLLKLAATPLLFVFPLWAAFPKIIAGLVLALLGAFALAVVAPSFGNRSKAQPECHR